nr:uncharacterized protein LOC106690565 [Halyomorpha halys]
MHRYCISFALLLAVSSGFRLEHFTTTSDYDIYADIIIAAIKDRLPNYSGTPLNLDITQIGTNGSSSIANFSGPPPTIGDFQTLSRSEPVITQLSPGKLNVEVTLTISNFTVIYPEATLTLFSQNFKIKVEVKITTNVIKIAFIVSSLPDGSCAVQVVNAGFTKIGGLNIKFDSLGFFNELNLKSEFNNLLKDFPEKLNFLIIPDPKYLSELLQNEVCSTMA